MKVVGITSCPSGVAHTYMAAEALKLSGQKLGIDVIIETQGGAGVENQLKQKDIDEAACVVLVNDVALEGLDRFKGKKVLKMRVSDLIKKSDAVMSWKRRSSSTMADIKKIATRVSYGNTLVELAQQGADNLVVFDADLAAATKTEIFRKEYPDRHFDCGIAEQNMVGVAAGMSTMGYVPFVSSFAMFVAGRGFEQIRNSIGYPHLNVKIGATHAGLSVGEDGASHQCCEDIALMRSIPGMVVLSPADDVEARAAVIAAYNYQGPVYLRFSRLATPVFHDPETYEFQIGKGEKLTDGYDIAVISTGLMTNEALRAAVLAKRQGLNVRVINMPTIKPIDEEIILTAARECGRIITVEEHSIIGGLGEAVCSVVSEKLPVPVRRIGVMDQFGHSGPANEVLRDYGLTADNIVNVIRDIVRPDAKA